MEELNLYLIRIRRRLRLVDGLALLQRLLWVSAIVALLTQLLGRLLPFENRVLWTLLPLPAWVLVVTGYSLFRPLSLSQVALRADTELHLFERISTSLALAEQSSAFPRTLVNAQHQDALKVARGIDPVRSFPVRWLYSSLRTAGLLLVIVLVSIFLPNPMDAILEQRAALEQAAREQAAKVEKLRQEINESQELSPEDRDELLRQFAELAEKLRQNPGDLEKALADLSKAEQSLQDKLDPNAGVKAAALQNLATRLETLAGLKPDSERQSAQSAAEALAQLAEQLDSLAPEERQKLASALAQMAAQAAQAGESSLAQALAAMAQAVQNDNPTAATQSAQAAAQTLAQAQQALQTQAALQQALAQLQASRQALTQAGQSIGAPGSTASQSQGQPSGNIQGQARSGGGSNAPVLPPSTAQGSARPPQGSKPGGPEDDLTSQVYFPRQQDLAGGNQLFIPGQDTGQGQSQIRQGEGQMPGSLNPALVPYYQVFYDYLYSANQAMQQSYIPASLADYIRQYFTQLEP